MLRRSPRALLLWIGAVAVTLVTALVVGTDLSALHRRARDLGPEVVVAVAERDLPVGDTLGSDDLRGRRVHRSQLPPGTIGPEELAGRVVAVPVLRDGFITEGNLAHRDRSGLDAVVPPGMRVVRIVAPVPTGALRIRSSYVDVLATFDVGTGPGIDSDGDEYSDPTVVVARGALVLGSDDTDTTATGADGTGAGVALLVTEEEARAVAYASAAAILTIALVPPEDARAPRPT